jgi:uncharacterized protein YdbL (DUF1318 family)
MKHLFINIIKKSSLLLMALAVSFSAFALDIKSAKQQGMVGEMTNGYLGVIVKNADTIALAKNVNNKRKQIYIKLARKNKLNLKQVAALAAEKAKKKTAKGHFIQDAAGKWVKK